MINRLLNPTRRHYLSLVGMLVRRELKVKYRGTVLGYLWSMLNPLLFMLTISFVFSHLVKGIENYNVYVLSGILFWNMTSLAVISGTHSIVANSSLIQKVKVPLWIFPFVPIGTSITNLALALVPYTLICIVSKIEPTTHMLLMPLVLVLSSLFLAGIALALSSLNVFFRDISHVLEPIMTLLFYATPIIYDRQSSQIPEAISKLLSLNPFVHYVEAFRATLLPSSGSIALTDFLLLLALSALSLMIGGFVYKRAKTKIPLSL